MKTMLALAFLASTTFAAHAAETISADFVVTNGIQTMLEAQQLGHIPHGKGFKLTICGMDPIHWGDLAPLQTIEVDVNCSTQQPDKNINYRLAVSYEPTEHAGQELIGGDDIAAPNGSIRVWQIAKTDGGYIKVNTTVMPN